MSLCLCAEAGSEYGGRRPGVGSPVLLFSFFFVCVCVLLVVVVHPRDLPPSLPQGNKRGFFSEEHGDVGGGCECGPCVRAAAAALFVCFPSPASGACANPQNYTPNFLCHRSQCDGHTMSACLHRLATMLIILWKRKLPPREQSGLINECRSHLKIAWHAILQAQIPRKA